MPTVILVMTDDLVDLVEAVRRGTAESAGSGQPERVLRDHVQPALQRTLEGRGVRSAARDEARLTVPLAAEASVLDAPLSASGRADAIYNRFVIEFEPPGSLRPSVLHRATRHAVSQVQQYLRGVSAESGIAIDRLAGCAFDGSWIVYIAAERGAWRVEPPQAVSNSTLSGLVDTLAALATGRGLTAENLDEDFGREGPHAAGTVSLLASFAATRSAGTRTHALMDQWLLDQENASGPFALRDAPDWRQLRQDFGVSGEVGDAEALFALQTYFALVSKLVSVVVLGGTSGADLMPHALASSDAPLWFRELEMGAVTSGARATNVIEPGLFSWYAFEDDPRLREQLAALVGVAEEYSSEVSEVTPVAGRDLMKRLYQRLVPSTIRHRLGEYYTPDWLAQYVINQVMQGPGFQLNQRVLDPACGSGTFLVEVLQRALNLAPREGASNVLSAVTANIVGFDLSPLAVQASKVNYLLAISPLLKRVEAPVAVPVFLADSVAPLQRAGVLQGDSYVLDTSVGQFRIPAELVESGGLPALRALFDQGLAGGQSSSEVATQAVSQLRLTGRSEGPIGQLYESIVELRASDRDGIWMPLIVNAFAPLLAGRFDFVVGNPPWVSWETLPEAYRRANSDQWDFYGLRPDPPPGRRQVSRNVRLDLSMLFAAVCVDRYLADSGRLGFVITATLFQSELAGRGFRRRSIPLSGSYRFLRIELMNPLGIFEDASNQSAVLLADRGGSEDQWPVPVTLWTSRDGPTIPVGSALATVRTRTRRAHWWGEPVDPQDRSSPILVLPEDALAASRPARRPSPYADTIREGINTRGANGAFFVEILEESDPEYMRVRNLPGEGRNRDMPFRNGIAERGAVRHLLRGEDVGPGEAIPVLGLMFFHDLEHLSDPLTEREAVARFPQAYSFMEPFKRVLQGRRRFRNFDATGDGWLGLYSVTTAAVAEHKVVIREISRGAIAAAVDDPLVIPDHKLYVIPVGSADEAAKLAAVLNSPVVDLLIRSFTLSTSLPGSFLRYVGIRSLADLDRGAGGDDFVRRALRLGPAEFTVLARAAEEIGSSSLSVA